VKSIGLPRVVGHRGAAASAPENTLAGFARAAAVGAAWVELDVQLSADGVPVVFHDDRVDRVTDGHGRLADMPMADLRRLDAGSWFGRAFAGERVPLLAEALEAIAGHGMGVNIEIKVDEVRGPATTAAALAVARSAWPADRPPPLVSSFARSALATAADVAADWPRGLLVEGWPKDWREVVLTLGCVSLNANWRRLTARRVAQVKSAGLAILAYTVNHPATARRLWAWGVDAVCSDRPERLIAGVCL
jgi:glycerophosphoryl diester phosphodiesterase